MNQLPRIITLLLPLMSQPITATTGSAEKHSVHSTTPSASASHRVCPPLFECTPTLADPYGICTHITRPWMDYPIRDRELALTRLAGIGWVRSDLDFGTAFDSPTGFHPQVFDSVVASCQQQQQQLLGILTWHKRLPWDDTNYGAYVDSLAARYHGRITHWEMMNEVNLMHVSDSLPQLYARALQTASTHLHQADRQNKVLLSGLGEVKDDFMEELCRMGAMKWVDIMNFHSYFRPEELMQCFWKIHRMMERYGWSKPVWLTECGMHTCAEQLPADVFYLDMLPNALAKVGINEKDACVGYLADRSTGYVTLTQEQADIYLKPMAGSVTSVTLEQLATLDARRVPVLVATTDEYFPMRHFQALTDYVRGGGTIVLAGGMPFYYDAALPSNTWFDRHETGTSLLHKLHMSPVQQWKDPVTGEELTDTPTVVRKADDAGFAYQWQIFDKCPARYLTADNLHPGDTLISLITAGTARRQAAVAGVYRLRSELKGNIIFQTRMYAHPLPDKEAEQARRLARTYLLAFAHGVDKVFWYNLRSRETDPYEPEDCFGLIHHDFTEKPSMQAMHTLTRMLPPGSTRPMLEVTDNVFRATWTRPDSCRVTAWWSPYTPVTQDVGKLKHSRMYDHMGQEIAHRRHGRKVELTDAVVYVVEQR